MPIFAAEKIRKTFWDSNQELKILTDVSLSLEKAEFACISGKSGCGKSTLLHILGLLEKPDSGRILINEREVSTLSADAPQMRNKLIGFVFQFHYLMDDLTALENVALPLMVAGNNRKESLEKAESLLSQLNLAQRLNHFPSQLSGGEQQRTALARALINNPSIILADEPTGNLDSAHSADVLELLQRINIDYGCTFLLVTHDLGIADKAQTHYKLENGTLYKLK